jgi:hypothetical protein
MTTQVENSEQEQEQEQGCCCAFLSVRGRTYDPDEKVRSRMKKEG